MFHHEQEHTPDGVVARIASVSHVAVLPDAERSEILARARAVLDEDPATRGHRTVAIPYRVDAYWYERR